MNIESLITHITPRREVRGMAAALLPYTDDGRIAVDSFQRQLQTMHRAGLMCAVNMDTGYVNYLADEEKQLVLDWAREALGPGVGFVAGAYIERHDGDNLVSLYRREMDAIVERGGIPIIFQSARMHGKSPREKIRLYADICRDYPEVLGFELGRMFAPNGEIFDAETVRGLMQIPSLTGIKHSSLDRMQEFGRLAIRDEMRPEFRIYTGNDLGINMIEYGSDYLLGLAAFAPEKFAERDRLWAAGDVRYYALSDALQHLGNIAFRAPVPAYKHAAAIFLHLTGKIPSPLAHTQSPRRPPWEAELLRDCATRLDLL
ncbi:MAG: dihydrodipicolinate synthase family protein [Pyrinomonadaceae bacterium]